MADTLLITLGCSWTYGVGVAYRPGMTADALMQHAWDEAACDQLSWRGVLCLRRGWNNKNLARGGASNQQQQRLAMAWFNSEEFAHMRQSHERIMVLWGITSTARNELWRLSSQDWYNFFYTTNSDPFARFMIQHSYDHDTEVAVLRQHMLHWNTFFCWPGHKEFLV